MQHYVLGIAVSGSDVVLIEKNRPEWQKDQLNFPGGKIEEALREEGQIHDLYIEETPEVAMRREFFEETGSDIPEWRHFGVIKGKDYRVELLYADNERAVNVETQTDEEVVLFDIDDILNGDYDVVGHKFVHNVKFLLQFAVTEFAKSGAKITLEYP